MGTAPTLAKGVYGVATRAAQALLLLVVIADFDGDVQSDVAISLTAAVAINLISNFGLPTALVRRLTATGEANPEIGLLTRAYLVATAAGMVLSGLLVGAVVGAPAAALAAAALLGSMSVTGLLEYWSLGTSRYPLFLRHAAPIHAVLGFTAAPLALLTGNAYVGLFALALAALAPLAVPWPRSVARDALQHARGARLVRSSPAMHDAARVGVGTAAAAVLYGADVFLLRLTGHVGEDASYRLAITGVSFAAGLLPAGFFALAHSAAGGSLRWSGALVSYLSAAIVVCLAGGAVASTFDASLGDAGRLLVLLAPLAAIRLATQVVAAHQHGRGEHGRVAALFGAATAVFVTAGLIGALVGGVHGLMAVQLTTETALLAAFLFRERRATAPFAVVNTPRG